MPITWVLVGLCSTALAFACVGLIGSDGAPLIAVALVAAVACFGAGAFAQVVRFKVRTDSIERSTLLRRTKITSDQLRSLSWIRIGRFRAVLIRHVHGRVAICLSLLVPAAQAALIAFIARHRDASSAESWDRFVAPDPRLGGYPDFCPRCGYYLAPTQALRCPECGDADSRASAAERAR